MLAHPQPANVSSDKSSIWLLFLARIDFMEESFMQGLIFKEMRRWLREAELNFTVFDQNIYRVDSET